MIPDSTFRHTFGLQLFNRQHSIKAFFFADSRFSNSL